MRAIAPALVLAAVFAASCGGSPLSDNSAATEVRVAGAFAGTYTIMGGQPSAVVGYVPDGGAGIFADSSDFWTLPTFSQAGAVSGTLGLVAPPGQSLTATEPVFSISGSATGSPATAIAGTVSDPQGSATFSLASVSAAPPNSGDYAGNENDLDESPVQITMAVDGSFTGATRTNCAISGSMVQTTQAGIYTVTIVDGAPSAGNLNECIGAGTGAAFTSSVDVLALRTKGVSGPYLYIIANGTANGLLLQLAQQ